MTKKEKVINELVEHIESALSVDSDYPHWCGFCGQAVKWE